MITKKRQFVIIRVMSLMLVILTAFCGGCEENKEKVASQVTSSEYKVVDSGVWSAESTDEKTVWLDNDRLVFVSNRTLTPGPDPKFLTVWNTSTGKVELSHQLTGLICGRNGQIMFAAKDQTTGKPKHYRGPIENPQEHPTPGPDMHLDHIFDCDWVPQATRELIAFSRLPYRWKMRGDNYQEIITPWTQTSHGKALYHEHQGSEGKEMPTAYPLSFNYSEFLDAYVVDSGMYDPTNPEIKSFWILERNGNLQEKPFPKAMLKGRQNIFPLKRGYLSEYRGGKYTATDPGDHGLWLLQGEKTVRLIGGTIHGASISPDGCKAAFIHSRNSNEYFSQKKPYRSVKIINFCIGETKP